MVTLSWILMDSHLSLHHQIILRLALPFFVLIRVVIIESNARNLSHFIMHATLRFVNSKLCYHFTLIY